MCFCPVSLASQECASCRVGWFLFAPSLKKHWTEEEQSGYWKKVNATDVYHLREQFGQLTSVCRLTTHSLAREASFLIQWEQRAAEGVDTLWGESRPDWMFPLLLVFFHSSYIVFRAHLRSSLISKIAASFYLIIFLSWSNWELSLFSLVGSDSKPWRVNCLIFRESY